MFGLLIRRVFRKQPIITQLIDSKRFSTKYIRELKLKKESKWESIRNIIFEANVDTNGNIDWNQLINEMVEKRLLFKQNFEVDLMSAFNSENDYDYNKVDRNLFESLVNYIRLVPNISSNTIAASRYCLFVSHFPQYIDESTVELIRETNDQLIQKYTKNKVPFDVIIDSVIALANSSKDNCLHAIHLLPQIRPINSKLINSIIDSSLKFKLFDQTFNLINTYTGTDFNLSPECLSNSVNTILESNLDSNKTIKLLNTFSNAFIIFDVILNSKFTEIMKRLGYRTVKTHVQPNGFCQKCGQTLKGVTFEEYKTLKNEMRSVIFNKDENFLLASFPEYTTELNNFENFMRKLTVKKPLDLVIDGLNVGYSTNGEIIADKRKLRNFVKVYKKDDIDEQLVEIILKNDVIEEYENILIIGRKHMKSWQKLNQLLNVQRDRVSCFYAMNKSEDDTYVLYAAIQNPKTKIISKDFYRNYFDKMEKKNLSTLFQRWLRSHQMIFGKNKLITLPDQFDYKIHFSEDNTAIHLPFGYFNTHEDFEINWICCQKKN